VVVVGASSVGKTSIIARFVNDTFDPCTPTTLGAAYLEINFEHPQANFNKLQIWDTSGQEKYRSIAKIYYKNSKIGLLVFDVTD
jgi:Ras-related protein Rab-5C